MKDDDFEESFGERWCFFSSLLHIRRIKKMALGLDQYIILFFSHFISLLLHLSALLSLGLALVSEGSMWLPLTLQGLHSQLAFSDKKKGYTSCPMAQPKFLTWFSWFGSCAHLWTNYCDHSRMGCPDWPDLDRMLTLGAHVDQEQRRRLRMLYKKGKGDSV